MFHRALIALAALVALAAAFMTFQAVATTSPNAIPEREPTTVEVITILPQPITLEVKAQGSVLPAVESRLIAEVSGRIVEVSSALVAGGAFNAGDVLLKLDDTQLLEQQEQARAQLSRAEAELRHAHFERERAAKLAADKLTSQAGLQNAERALKVAQASARDAEARLAQAERDLGRTTVVAPYGGRVRQESVDVGQFLSRGAAIATVYADEAVEVRLPINDRELAFLDIPLTLQGGIPLERQPTVALSTEFGGQQMHWQGRVVRRDAQIDGFSRMVHLIARVDADDGSMPLPVGLFVDATIQGSQLQEAIVLPRSALRSDGSVMVVDGEDRLRIRAVDALRLSDDRVLVRSGLNGGERVCLSPVATPVDGMFVTPVIAG